MSIVGRMCKKTPAPTASPSLADIAWAAGFIEGEGNFSRAAKSSSGGFIQVCQTEREPLERLQRWFGGSIALRITPRLGKKPLFRWYLCGPRGRGVMLTIFTFMSARRRQQIKWAW